MTCKKCSLSCPFLVFPPFIVSSDLCRNENEVYSRENGEGEGETEVTESLNYCRRRISNSWHFGSVRAALCFLWVPTYYQALSYKQTDFDVTTGQCFVSDKNLANAILIRHRTLSDGEV